VVSRCDHCCQDPQLRERSAGSEQAQPGARGIEGYASDHHDGQLAKEEQESTQAADALEHGKLPGYAAKTPAEKRFWRHCNGLDTNKGAEPGPYAPSRPGELTFWFHLCHAYEFERFIDNVIRIKPDVPSRAMMQRIGYQKVTTDLWRPDEYTVDFVGHTETLVDDFVSALKLAGEPFDENVVRNVRPKRVSGRLPKYRQKMKWRPDQRKAIYAANRQLFDGFGYTV